MHSWILDACLCFGFAAALMAGVFLSFSDFVMAGLIRSKPASGIESMQQLNRTVFRSVFLTTFLLLVPLTVGFALYVASGAAGAGRTYVIAAAVTYFLFVFGVTVVGNVPMNNRLDEMQPDSNEAASYWKTYADVWTRWNHVRTLGATVTAVLFLCAATAFGSATPRDNAMSTPETGTTSVGAGVAVTGVTRARLQSPQSLRR